MRLTRFLLVLASVVGAIFAFGLAQAHAATMTEQDACPPPYTTGYTCQFQPATVTTQSHTHVVIEKKVKEQIKQYESVQHVTVAVNMRPGGVKSLKGCVNPVSKGWIKPGGTFNNTRKDGSRFWDRWVNGLLICNPHRVKIGKGKKATWWMQGTKSNCGNRNIRIQVRGPRRRVKVRPVIVFRTVKQFQEVYDKWVTSTTTTVYSCQSGWTLTYVNGKAMCFMPTPVPPSVTTYTASANATAIATATATVTVNCAAGSTTATATATASGSATATGFATETSTISQQDAYNKAEAAAQANANANAQSSTVQASAYVNAQANATASATAECVPAPAPSVTITGCVTINQVPAGQPSGQLTCMVNASAAGSFTINPNLGAVSDCNGGSKQSSLVVPLSAGNNTICYYYYAPNDADQPPSDTITYTAIVTTAGGTAKDVKTQTFAITYPTRT